MGEVPHNTPPPPTTNHPPHHKHTQTFPPKNPNNTPNHHTHCRAFYFVPSHGKVLPDLFYSSIWVLILFPSFSSTLSSCEPSLVSPPLRFASPPYSQHVPCPRSAFNIILTTIPKSRGLSPHGTPALLILYWSSYSPVSKSTLLSLSVPLVFLTTRCLPNPGKLPFEVALSRRSLWNTLPRDSFAPHIFPYSNHKTHLFLFLIIAPRSPPIWASLFSSVYSVLRSLSAMALKYNLTLPNPFF